MQSVNKSNDQHERTFIEEARRNQIIDATITVLANHGYGNTSFARIAKQAGISASLIPYHFKNKEELTRAVFEYAVAQRIQNVKPAVDKASTAAAKLKVFIQADLANMAANQELFKASAEVLFSMRDAEGAMDYMAEHEDPLMKELINILVEGQKSGEFKECNVQDAAIIIVGARDTFLALYSTQSTFDLARFTNTLITTAMAMLTEKTDAK